jgi:hypothetical protein
MLSPHIITLIWTETLLVKNLLWKTFASSIQQNIKAHCIWQPLWSSGLATDPEVWVLFPALPDFLRSSGPLWSSGQSSWLQMQRSGFDSRSYQISWEVVSLERGPLSLVSTTEELLDRKSGGSGLENREYCRRDPPRWPRGTLYPQKLAVTSPTRGGR